MSDSTWTQGVQGSGPAIGHDSQTDNRPASAEDHLPAVRALVIDLLEAMADKDWDRFTGCFQNDAVLFQEPDETGQPKVSNLPEALPELWNWFDGHRSQQPVSIRTRVTMRNLEFDLRENIALVNLKGGKDRAKTRVLVVTQDKDSQKWLIRHFHAPAVFED